MLLLILAGLRVLVLEDKVNLGKRLASGHPKLKAHRAPHLVGSTALVGTKHDHIGRGIGEFLSMELLVFLKELQVGTTADQGICGMRSDTLHT